MSTIQTTTARQGFGFRTDSMTPVHWLAAALAVITGSIHVYLYLNQGFLPFLFAGVVFFAAVVGVLLNVYRRALYALGVPFTAGQIAFWVLLGTPDFAIGVVDKAVQVALIVALVYLFRTEGRTTATR